MAWVGEKVEGQNFEQRVQREKEKARPIQLQGVTRRCFQTMKDSK